MKSKQLSEVWLKAAILGATWAASEIILGSFLHNLRIPFKGNILTAIGFILMISISYKWKDKGLFWRSGLICALMKVMSPSAVIFGPMIAIFMESVLLEFSVRIFGRNLVGFLLGSALAMSWILVQKIVNFILFYGFNIVDIYTQLMNFAEKQLNIQFDLVWLPILILLFIYILFGIAAVFIGRKIGKNLINDTGTVPFETNQNSFDFLPNKTNNFPYSLTWLFLNFIVLIGMLFLINKSPVYVWAITAILVILVWTQRYKRGMRQLSKPSFWIFFVIITMVTAFVITSIQMDKGSWEQGLIVGLQMNFRAAIVIVGFSVLGTELYNPKIRNYFAKTAFKQLPIALELAFESLPVIISSLPNVKSFFNKPSVVFKNLIYQAEKRLNEINASHRKQVFIITGDIAQGKTSFTSRLIIFLQENNIKLGGFYAPKIIHEKNTAGYDIVNISSGERLAFLRENKPSETASIGKFKVNSASLEVGKQWLNLNKLYDKELVIIDEVGKWELNNLGWADSLNVVAKIPNIALLLIVRETFIEHVISKWGFQNVTIFNVNDVEVKAVGKKIIEILKNS